MTDQELSARCHDWAHWCHTRKYFAPPVPQNILAQFQPRRRPAREPDGPLDPDLAFLNMAIHSLAEEFPEESLCFSLYYFHQFSPVKSIWRALEIGERTFYDRIHRFARRALKASARIKRIHLEHTADEAAVESPAEIQVI